MATETSTYGLAKLDLAGNRIVWDRNDTQHNKILLEGWRFRLVVPMVTLAISCLCLLCFFAILIGLCAVYCGRRDTSKYLPWHSVWVPVFCMIGFFMSDIANRVFHELQRMEPWEYIGVNIVIGSLASIADGLLMVYLLNKSPVDVIHGGWLSLIAMVLAVVVYWIIGTASKGTQIWNLVVQNSAPDPQAGSGSDDTSPIITKSLVIFQDLDTVASGMQLLFAIGFALLARRYLNHLSQVEKRRKRLTFAVSVLALAFLSRNAVKFAFTLVYSQLGKIAPLAIQLVFMAVYGPLSATIWACIISIAHMRGKESNSRSGSPISANTASTTPVYHKVAQMSVGEAENREYPYQQYHAKPSVMVDVYPAPQGYESYRHQNINQNY